MPKKFPLNDVMHMFSTAVIGGRVCQELTSGYVLVDAKWLATHGALFRMHN